MARGRAPRCSRRSSPARAARDRAPLLPQRRAPLRGRDLRWALDLAIEVEAVSKRYLPRRGPRGTAGRCSRRSRSAGCPGSGRATVTSGREELWSLREVDLAVEEGEALGLVGPQRRRQEHPAEDPRPHHRADRGRQPDAGPGGVPARGRHRVPPGAHRPGERVPERRHPRHVAEGGRAPLRRDRRVLGRRALPRHPDEALLVGDVPAARLRGGRPPRFGGAARRRGAGGGRRGVPAQVPRQDGRRREQRPDDRVREPQPRCHPAPLPGSGVVGEGPGGHAGPDRGGDRPLPGRRRPPRGRGAVQRTGRGPGRTSSGSRSRARTAGRPRCSSAATPSPSR